MLDVIHNINKQEALARALEEAHQGIATIGDKIGSSDGNPLEGDWPRFPKANALDVGIQSYIRQSNVGQYYVGQSDA